MLSSGAMAGQEVGMLSYGAVAGQEVGHDLKSIVRNTRFAFSLKDNAVALTLCAPVGCSKHCVVSCWFTRRCPYTCKRPPACRRG